VPPLDENVHGAAERVRCSRDGDVGRIRCDGEATSVRRDQLWHFSDAVDLNQVRRYDRHADHKPREGDDVLEDRAAHPWEVNTIAIADGIALDVDA
jgi:hypothetical protein